MEIELKLTLDGPDLLALRKHPRLEGAVRKDEDRLESLYYDTADVRLR